MNNGTDGKLSAMSRSSRLAVVVVLTFLLLAACKGGSQVDQPAQASEAVPPAAAAAAQVAVRAAVQAAVSARASYPLAVLISSAPADPPIALPAYLVRTPYPATGTTLIRVTDQAAFGVTARVLKHDYARRAGWNADGSRLMLVRPYPARILNASDLGHWESHNTPADALWSNTDPDLIYGLTNGNTLVRYSVATRRMSTIRVFDDYSQLSIGGGEAVQSDDDRRVVLIGQRSGGVDVIVSSLGSEAGNEAGKPQATGAAGDGEQRLRFDGFTAPNGDIDWAGISPSGDYVVVKVHRGAQGDLGFDVYDRRTLALLRRLLPGSEAHADMGFDRDGHEVLVSMAAGSSAIVSARLADGFVRQELPAAVVSYNNHVSCRNVRRPGWCYVSTYSDPAGHSAPLYRGIFSLRLDGDGFVERFAPALFAQDPVDLTYERQAWAVPSPLGDRVLFGSDWGDGSAQAVVHSYVAGVAGVAGVAEGPVSAGVKASDQRSMIRPDE